LKDGWKRGFASSKRVQGTLAKHSSNRNERIRSKSLLSEEHSHQNTLLKLKFAAGYTLLVVHSLNDGIAVVSLPLLEPGDQEAQP